MILLILVTLLAMLTVPAPAGAVSNSEELGQFGSSGEGSGQFKFSPHMASSSITGHLYIADFGNRRISEFTAWGEFVSAWGWGVSNGDAELQRCTTECREGLPGTGPGQFQNISYVAVDSAGYVYVYDAGALRVQKFTPSGDFVLMFGGGVNKSTGGDICTLDSGDECQAGMEGDGPGEFKSGTVGIDVDQSGAILVATKNRVQKFDANGQFQSELSLPKDASEFAAESNGPYFYVVLWKDQLASTERLENKVRKFDQAGQEVGSVAVYQPGAIALDGKGSLYVVRGAEGPHEGFPNGILERVIEFSSSGVETSDCCEPGFNGVSTLGPLAVNTADDLYVGTREFSPREDSHITIYGPPPVQWPPPQVPPAIISQYVASAESTSATLKAEINPNFFSDTKFYVEYGLADCISGPCIHQPGGPGVKLGSGAVKKVVNSPGIVLTDLKPGSVYHYRFVAHSGGGGPVFGPDETFRTFPVGNEQDICSNQLLRFGPAARLPDCRAYEMVSPVDKNNGDILTLGDVTGYETKLNQGSPDGEALTFSSYRAFAGAGGAPWTAQYLSRRSPSGWETEALSGARTASMYEALFPENEFKAFSPDLCDAWMVYDAEPILAPGAVAGFPNVYRRENCPKRYEALSPVAPPSNVSPGFYYFDLQGFSADGSRTIFVAEAKLTDDAADRKPQLYEASGGKLTLVCVFPETTPAKVKAEFPNCSAGSAGEASFNFATTLGRLASVSHAISDDGSRIYWSAFGNAGGAPGGGVGKLYLRLNGTTTLPVSEAPGAGTTTKAVRFWGASPDGAKALYEVEDPTTSKDRNLYLYDLASEESSFVAGKVSSVAATSEDLSRIYLISKEAIAGTQGATAGAENLYLHEGSRDTFIAALSAVDVDLRVKSNGSRWPIFHVARATPDGGALAFVSTRPLTGFDNTDQQTGAADSEVFNYEAESDTLSCVSCSPAGARPSGRVVFSQTNSGSLPTAGSLPGGETQLYTPRALSDDGNRLFFTAYTDLVPADANGVADVYQWVRPGAGRCTETSSSFSAINSGCLYLISSGTSPADSEFVDSSADGRDVFFTTNASLLPQDPGLVDIYDARANGGFPLPAPVRAPCEGEACQGPPAPPNDPTPTSLTFSGAGNARSVQAKKHRKKAHPKKKSKSRKQKNNKRRTKR